MLRCTLVITLLTAACGGGDDSPAADAGVPSPDATIPPARGQFPAGFLWGTANAPYQVEGNLHQTDWYQWESEYCDHCPPGESADDGPNFWDNYELDLANAAALSNNAIRIGIDWSRVFPTEAQFPDNPDAEAVARYHAILDAARAHGLAPMVTLHHFASPVWIQDLSDPDVRGWEDEATIAKFAAFAGWAAAEFGDDVDHWVTINEPTAYLIGGWIAGDTPPGKSFAIDEALTVAYHMIEGHARAYDAIHERDLVDADADGAAALVSIAQHSRVFIPKDPGDPDHVRATDMIRYLSNEVFLNGVVFGNIDKNFDYDFDDPEDVADDDSIKGRLDYIGLNYYGVSLVIPTANDNNFPMIGLPLISDLDRQGLPGPISDFGWTLYPEGFREVLDELEPYDLPIIITENGIADATDSQRPRFVIDHLYALNKAIDEGVDLRGYFHWSLTDNFEWSSGFCPRFGLYGIDYAAAGKPRVMREGGEVYRRIIDDNTVDPQLFATYPGYPGSDTACPRLPL